MFFSYLPHIVFSIFPTILSKLVYIQLLRGRFLKSLSNECKISEICQLSAVFDNSYHGTIVHIPQECPLNRQYPKQYHTAHSPASCVLLKFKKL